MAARSLISLFREQNPELLHRRDRGRTATMAQGQHSTQAFGEDTLALDVAGAEFLVCSKCVWAY